MTPEQHNKYVGLAHLAHAGFYCLMMVLMFGFFAAMIWAIPDPPGRNNDPPTAFLVIVFIFIAVVNGAFALPSVVAGYALLKRKRWAKLASIIAAVLAGMFFPTGTAVCIYTLWFIFSEPGKLLYDQPAQMLPPAPPQWFNTPKEVEAPYEQPKSPPNWR